MKKLLVIIPFKSIYPPMSGGMQRGMNILNQVCKYYKVTAIIHQDLDSFKKAFQHFPALKDCKIISTANGKPARDLFSILPARLAKAIRYRYLTRSLKGITSDNFLLIYPILKELLQKEKFDHILLEDIGLIDLVDLIRKRQPGCTIIYDAYNVNSDLAKAAGAGSDYAIIKQEESRLHAVVDGIFTCSLQDLNILKEMNQGKLNGFVIPNGVNIAPHAKARTRYDGDEILFCGSLEYHPNEEGLLWFCNEVLPLVVAEKPSVKLMVVGKGRPSAELSASLRNSSIINYGMVDDVGVYYDKAAIAIIPLLSGSGTRLKLLEAMGYNVAVVSTSKGAEGIDYTHEKDILIADDKHSFAKCIVRLLNNRVEAARIAGQGLKLVEEKYDWNIVGKKLSQDLQEIVTS